MKPCPSCLDSPGWQPTTGDSVLPGMREGVCCGTCRGTCVVPETPAEIAKANKRRVYTIAHTKGPKRLAELREVAS